MATAASLAQVQKVYVAYYNRPADPLGQAYWADKLDAANGNLSAIINAFGNSAEAKALYGSLENTAAVTALYQQLFGRAPDAAGLKFYVDGLVAGTYTLASIALNVANGASGTDATIIANKITVANAFTAALDQPSEVLSYSGDAAAAQARALIATVTDAAATVTTATANVAATVTAIGSNTGSTFTLTTSADTLIGTSSNDTFVGVNANFSASNDSVIDASTTDNDTYNLSVSAADVGDHKVVNVENVNVTISSTSGPDTVARHGGVRADSFVGVKNLTVTRSDISLGGETIIGNKAVQVVNLDASNVSAVTAGAGTTTVNVEQATKAGVTINANVATGAASGSVGVQVVGAATVNAENATGTVDMNLLGVTAEDAKAVVVNAAKANAIDLEAFTGSITVNAAAATTVTLAGAKGGAVVNAASSTNTTVSAIDDSGVTLNLGGAYTRTAKGDINLDGTASTSDVATISAGGFVTLDTKGGTGTVETINISGNGAALTATIDASSTGMKAINVTGSQNVRIEAGAEDLAGLKLTDSSSATSTVAINAAVNASLNATKDYSELGADKFELTADADNDSVDTLTFASGASLVIAADQTDVYIDGAATKATLSISTGDDTLSSTTGLPSGATVDISVGELNVDTNVTTLNIDASTGTLSATKLVGSSTTAVNITGTKNITISTSTGSQNVAKSINAANFTGKLDMYVGDTATVTTGSGIDTIRLTGTSTVYSLDTGAGNDVVTVTGVATASLVATGSGDDAITVADADEIVIAAGTGSDTVTINSAIDTSAVYAGGEGSDTLKFAQNGAAVDLSDNTNFAFAGFETVDVTALDGAAYTITMNHSQVGTQAFTLKGNSTSDNLVIVDKDAVGSLSSNKYTEASSSDVIDLRNITTDTASVIAQVGQGSNTLYGTSATNDTLDVSKLYDAIDKGATTNTKAATGVVVNLSASTIADTTLSAWGAYVPSQGSGIASGKAAYLFDNTATTANSSSAINTFSGFESVIGSGGADYIVGSADANTITAGLGADYIKAGSGDDTIVLTEGSDSKDKVVFESTAAANGADTITGFIEGSGKDQLDFTAFLGASPTALVAATADPSSATDFSGKVLVLKDLSSGQDIKTASGLTTALAASGEYEHYDMTASTKAIAITYATSGANTVGYMFMLSANASAVITATLVGQVTVGTAISGLDATNFA